MLGKRLEKGGKDALDLQNTENQMDKSMEHEIVHTAL